MGRLALASFALAIIGLALACGGGGSRGSVNYAPTVVPIKHIDFAGVELSIADAISPPPSFVARYPAVVATVNGQPVSRESLVYSEIAFETNRRQRQAADVLHLLSPSDLGSGDSLGSAIKIALRHQAVLRLKLLPSLAEAVRFTQHAENITLHPEKTPENQALILAALRRKGLPESNWAADPKIVDQYRYAMGDMKLSTEICKPLHTPVMPANEALGYRSSGTCDEFLAKERQNAKIVYYVRWAD